MENLALYYVIGWIIWSLVLVKDGSFKDILASFIVGLVWPIQVPVMIIKRLMRY